MTTVVIRYERLKAPIKAYLWARFAVLFAIIISLVYFMTHLPGWRAVALNLYLFSFTYILANLILLKISKEFEYILLYLLSDVLIVSYLYRLYHITGIPFSIFYLFPLFVGGLILPKTQLILLATITVVLFSALSIHLSFVFIGLHIFSFALILIASVILKKDITEIEKERTKAERWKSLYQKVVNYIPSGVVVFDKKGHIHLANPWAKKISGKELVGLNMKDFSSHPPKTLIKEIYARKEGEIKGKDGVIPIGYMVVPFEEDLFLMVFADMTEVKKLEEEKRRAKLLAILGRMSADLAHDIKNPLSAIRSAAEVLAEAEFENEEARDLVKIIIEESERLDTLASDFLLFAKPTHSPKERKEIDIYSLLSEVCSRAKYKEKVEMAGEAPLPVKGYPSQLERVFINILDNAIEADKSEKKVGVYCTAEGKWVKVGIRDHGPGIPEEIKEEIFTPFFSTKKDGIGLGLSISHRIVQAHGGKIFVETPSDGEGTLVVVTLPLLKESSDERAEDTGSR